MYESLFVITVCILIVMAISFMWYLTTYSSEHDKKVEELEKTLSEKQDELAKSIKEEIAKYSAQNIEEALAYLFASKVRLKLILMKSDPTNRPDHKIQLFLDRKFPLDRPYTPSYYMDILKYNPSIKIESLALYKKHYDEFQKLEHELMVKTWNLLEADASQEAYASASTLADEPKKKKSR